jgi:phosphatidylinositol alpha-mannosyltransferase
MTVTASPVRVDLLAPCFWPEVRRGTERFARELSDELLARGHRPRLVTSHPARSLSRTVEDGLPIVRVPRPPDGRLRRRMFEDYLTHVPLTYAAVRLGDADITQALAAPDALAAARWRARTGRPAILSYMGIPDHDGLMAKRRRLDIMLKVLPQLDAVVALSTAARDAFWRWLGVEARVIAPGVNLDAFAVGSTRADAPTVICTADLGEPRKNVALLLDAFALVRRERPDARLVLSKPRTATAAADQAAARDGVEIADLDDRAALARAYGEAWVNVLPSFGEAFGLVLVEALATGTPVVASALGGMAEIVDRPEIGRLFDGRDAEALSRAILEAFELSEQPATRATCRARAEAFSTTACADRYVELYEELR